MDTIRESHTDLAQLQSVLENAALVIGTQSETL